MSWRIPNPSACLVLFRNWSTRVFIISLILNSHRIKNQFYCFRGIRFTHKQTIIILFLKRRKIILILIWDWKKLNFLYSRLLKLEKIRVVSNSTMIKILISLKISSESKKSYLFNLSIPKLLKQLSPGTSQSQLMENLLKLNITSN